MEVLLSIPEVRRAGIAHARGRRNESLPQTVPNPSYVEGGEAPAEIPNPDLIESDEAYVQWVVDQATLSYAANVPTIPEPEPEDPGTVDGVPQVVTRKQAIKALARAHQAPVNYAGPILENTIEAIIAQMPTGTTEQQIAKVDTEAEFRYAQTWRRQNPVLIGLSQVLGLSSTQLDELFKLAATFKD